MGLGQERKGDPMIHRRSIIAGLLAAPFVSRIPGLLMPVRVVDVSPPENAWSIHSLMVSSFAANAGITFSARVVDCVTGELRTLSAPVIGSRATISIDRACRVLDWSLDHGPANGPTVMLDIRGYA